MLSLVFFIILLRKATGNLAVHHDLGFLVPDGTQSFPMSSVNTLAKINFPTLHNETTAVRKKMDEIDKVIETKDVFSQTHMMKFAPLYDLSKDCLVYTAKIKLLCNGILGLEGQELNTDPSIEYNRTITLNSQFLSSKLDLLDINPLLLEIQTKTVGFVATDPGAREKKRFQQILENFTFLTFTLRELKDELSLLNQILKNFKNKDVNSLNDKSFLSILSLYFKGEFEILTVHNFWYEQGRHQANISVLEFNNYTHFTAYRPLQYFNHRITNKLYSSLDKSDINVNESSSDLFEIHCSKQYFCQPIKTGCSIALDNDDFTDIFRHCDIEYSDNLYDVILDSGIVLNSPHFDNDTTKFLKEIQVYNISSYPVSIQHKACFEDTFQGKKQYCFPGPRKISYSRFAEHILYKILKPLWHSKILDNLSDSSLIITFIILLLILIASLCTCKVGTKIFIRKFRHHRQLRKDANNPKNHPMTRCTISPDRKVHSKILKRHANELKDKRGQYGALATREI